MMSGLDVRAAISDPLPLLRAGVVAALLPEGYRVEEPTDVLEWSAAGDPALVLIGLDGHAQWDLLGDLGRHRPAVTTVALVPDHAMDAHVRAIRYGAVAVIPRDVLPGRLQETCRAVLRGESVLPIAVVRDLIRGAGRWPADEVRLDERELAWFRQLSRGGTVAQVASASGYSERMMFRLLRELYERLGVTGRTEAMLLAREQGWI